MFDASEPQSLTSFVSERLKRQVLAFQDYTLLTVRGIANIFSPPWYLADLTSQMDVIGVGSLPIVLTAGFFIGVVLLLQTAAQFQRFGETALTGDIVSLALVRELGPTITALLVAGRNASGIASELGSMVVTEQVDAMRALGTDPMRKLVTPRIVATILMLPILTAFADLVGLIGGFLVSALQLRLAPAEFWHRAINVLAFGDLVQGGVKPLVFGLILASVGCYFGLSVRGGTQGVGRATTTAVVVSSVTIIVADAFLSKIFLYMF
ncbi:MAG TPA: ABC transporter permease [Candidatus Acidoferrales bacterium]|nr:ABC transporter permease [Candidatus Acidoferrales bacterium]